MRGLSTLKTMRLCGFKPSLVNIGMDPVQPWVKALTDEQSRHMQILVEPSDLPSLETTDLRPVVGLLVSITGSSKHDVERMAVACNKAGAKVVHAFWFDPDGKEYQQPAKAMRFEGDEVKTVWPK
jgi:elongation factor P hydroxylase